MTQGGDKGTQPDAELEDPGGVQAGINRYRDLAKWIVAVFAAIGGLLAAGSQLTSLGQLDLEKDTWRLVSASVGLAVALAGAMYIIYQALKILRPIETRLQSLSSDPISDQFAADRILPFGASTIEEVIGDYQGIMAAPEEVVSEEEKEEADKEVGSFLDRVAYAKATQTFTSAWKRMIGAAAVGAAAIAVFAYAANPEEPAEEAASAVPPQPSAVAVRLTEPGAAAMKSVLGQACVEPDSEGVIEVDAIAIGGSEDSPVLISQPSSSCQLARFSLSTGQGTVLARATAPTPSD